MNPFLCVPPPEFRTISPHPISAQINKPPLLSRDPQDNRARNGPEPHEAASQEASGVPEGVLFAGRLPFMGDRRSCVPQGSISFTGGLSISGRHEAAFLVGSHAEGEGC